VGAGRARTAGLLFSDIEGSTRLLQQLGPAFDDVLLEHHEILRAAWRANGGHVRGTEGDSFFVLFPSADAAVAAARDAQHGMTHHRFPHDAEVRVRIGVHVGEVRELADDFVGLAIHEAARIGAAAHGGQVLVSEAVLDAGVELEGVAWRVLGRHRLKDVGDFNLFQLDDPGLPRDFPPPRAQGSSRSNLPAQTSAFIGREAEVQEVRTRLRASRLLTLTGAGGSGKSRVALRAAAEEVDHFPAGVWFIDLVPLSAPSSADVEQHIAHALGLSGAGDDLGAMLAGRHALLVIDNCEHVVEPVAAVVEEVLRRAEGVTVLATSREPLGLRGETVWRIPPMTEDDALALMATRGAAASAAFAVTDANREVVVELIRQLDAIPLALELAAARLESLSPTQLVERLGERFRLLTSRGSGAMARQRTLQATVDWSYELLGDEEKALLRRVGVFVGAFDLAAAAAVCDPTTDPLDVLDRIGQLVAKSLAIAEHRDGQVHYRLLETIRQYAIDRLVEAQEVDRVRDAHLEWVSRVAADGIGPLYDGSGVGEQAYLEVLDGVGANVRAAIDWAVNTGRADRAAVLLFDTMPWFLARGGAAEGFALASSILDHAEEERALAAFVAIVFHGDFRWHVPEVTERCRAASPGIERSARPWVASLLQSLLDTAPLSYDTSPATIARALTSAGAAVIDADAGAPGFVNALARQHLHIAYVDAGELERSARMLLEGLSIVERSGLRTGICRLHQALARVAFEQGAWGAAREQAEIALAVSRELGDLQICVSSAHLLAQSATRQGDAESVVPLLVGIVDDVTPVHDPNTVAALRMLIAWAANHAGAFAVAKATAEATLEDASTAPPYVLYVRLMLAVACHGLGDVRRAWEALLDWTPSERAAAEETLPELVAELGAILLDTGDLTNAAVLLRSAAATRQGESYPDDPDQRRLDVRLDRARRALGEGWAAVRPLSVDDALRLARTLPVPQDVRLT
jgi:predicted ATPase/class 3 adenylate cyclase